MRIFKKNQRHRITMRLNGQTVSGFAEPRMLLSDFLRDEIGSTGTHVGCEHGVCGACTILLEGNTVRSCLTFAVQADDKEIQTVEGLAKGTADLSDLQDAFRRHHALQCGFCTPGILMSMTKLLIQNPKPTEEQVRVTLGGHLCRCTGYQPIIEAVLDVSASRASAETITENRS